MKKLMIPMVLTTIGFALFISACTPEPLTTPPVLTIIPSEPVNAKIGDNLTYDVIVSSDTDLSSVGLTASQAGTELYKHDTTFVAGIQSANLSFSFTLPATVAAGSTVTLEFLATNASDSKLVTTTINVQAGEIFTYTAVIMSDLENPEGSSFYSLEDNKLMSLNQAAAASGEVDLIYYYGATNKATLCAPSDQAVRAFTDSHGAVVVDRLEIKNNTKIAIVDMTVADFEAVANDGPILAKKPATTLTATSNLAKDKVIYCETVTGKNALVLVKNISGGVGTSYITIEVKVQK